MPKLLVIDDEVDICEMVKDFFGKRGYNVIYSTTGQGGLDAFSIEKPDVVLLDLCLKDIFGLEILKKIKRIRPSCIVMVVTGSASEDDRRGAIKLGADHYMTKPFSIAELYRLVGVLIKVIEKRRALC